MNVNTQQKFGIKYDDSRCIGCLSCIAACRNSHGGQALINVIKLGPKLHYISPCKNCSDPACISVCIKKAISRDKSGRLSIDKSICIECGSCAMACPFGAVVFDDGYGICDLCSSINESEDYIPNCIASCPSNALRITNNNLQYNRL